MSQDEEQQENIDRMQKQITQLSVKLSQIEDQMSIQSSHQKQIIQQNDEYVQSYMAIQKTIERLKNIFQDEQGEEITINLQTYLQQRVVENVLSELKFNQVVSQLENKSKEQFNTFNLKVEKIYDTQNNIQSTLDIITQDIKNNTELTHKNQLFKETMDRIVNCQDKSEKMIQEALDRFWKYDQQIQTLSSQISQKVEQNQISEIQNQLKDNFVGIDHYQSQLEMLLGKINAKTDSNYFEEKFNYIDKAVLQTSQKFEEQIEKDLKIYFSKMLSSYLIKQDLETGLNIIRQENKKEWTNFEQELQNYKNGIYSQLQDNQNNTLQNFRLIETLKSEQVSINSQMKSYYNDSLSRIQQFETLLQRQGNDLLKKIELKPSLVDVKLVESKLESKLIDFQQKISQYFKELEDKSQKEEEGLRKMEVQLSGVVTLDALQQKWVYIESLKEESIRIKSDQDSFRKQFKFIEERLAVKISKFEIDQLRNSIELQYVKIPIFDSSVEQQKNLLKNVENSFENQLKERDILIEKFRQEQVQLIDKTKILISEFQKETESQQNKIQQEQDIQRYHLETCKKLAQKVDESLIYKASKIDLNEFMSFCSSKYIDRQQLTNIIELRDEFVQMRKIEDDLMKFKQEYKSWIDNFNKRMCFSFDTTMPSPIQFQWVEEIKDKIHEISQIKFILSQKAEHSDLIKLFQQKANKNLVNNLLSTCRSFKKQMIYEIISVQSFIKCMSSRSDLIPSQQQQIQMNLRQLTKLLKWISFSSLEGDIDNHSDQSLKMTIDESAFAQMEKVSDSVHAKFKLFQKKVEEMGEAKFVSSENKILDEYLSMIMQDPAHEEIYGNKQSQDVANIINQNTSESIQQKNAINNQQTIMRPFKIRKSTKQNYSTHISSDNNSTRKKTLMNFDTYQDDDCSEKNQGMSNLNKTIMNQNTRETSTFYDPQTQFSYSQKNSPSYSSSLNHFFPNDSQDSLKLSQIRQENKTIHIGGNTYEVSDMEEFNNNLNKMNASSTKSVQINQFINLAIQSNNSNQYKSNQSTSLSINPDQNRFQQFYVNKNQSKKNKFIIQNNSAQKNHSLSQSPQTSSSLSRISKS